MKASNTLIALSVLLLSGCGLRLQGVVSGLTAPNAQELRTFIVLQPDDVPTTDLQYQDYMSRVSAAMQRRGYIEIPANEASTRKPDLIVFLTTGIGSPRARTYTQSIPVFGQTGTTGSTTTGQATYNPYLKSANYNSQTTYQNTYGITGYNNIQQSVTECDRYLKLDAIDFRTYLATEGKTIAPAWQTSITSTGSTCNLPMAFPTLLFAIEPYIGTSMTPKAVAVPMQK